MSGLGKDLAALALDCGFSRSGPLNAGGLAVREEVRAACAENKCRAYGSNWTCPPACGTLEECRARLHSFAAGLILQTTGSLEDSLDYEAMEDIGRRHREHINAFGDALEKRGIGFLLLGAGPCGRCKTCAYPEPCLFPRRMISSMEAYGLVVSDVCRDNGLSYYYGAGTLTYVGCVLF